VAVAVGCAIAGISIASAVSRPAGPATGDGHGSRPGGGRPAAAAGTQGTGTRRTGAPGTGAPGAKTPRPTAPGGPYADAEAGFRRAVTRLAAAGYQADLTTRLGGGCAASSYGQVQAFFRGHPCQWLARAYVTVRKGDTGIALVAISWVQMPSAGQAAAYKRLVDAAGTGNITELSRLTGPDRSVTFTGLYYLSGQSGAAVWNVQAQPPRPGNAAALRAVLDDCRQ
jgi:hypothetical protein